MRRVFDVTAALTALLLVSPVWLAIVLFIKGEDGGPILYRGRRVGLNGSVFLMFKFRSMVLNAERLGGSSTSNDDPRITKAGRVLRRYKLDELPQLLNVLNGTMHLVGPRPEVQKYTDLYTGEERQILSVRPGITDWASIWNSDEGAVLAGSSDPERAYEELIRPTKLRLQLFYVRTRSLTGDARILLYTLRKLFDKHYVPPELAPYPKPTPLLSVSQHA